MIIDCREKEFDLNKTGNKAYHLHELFRAGFHVPAFFVLDTDVYDAAVRDDATNDPILPDAIRDEILSRTKGGTLYAVRSSSTMEDLSADSFAGQYESYLNVRKDEIEQRVKDCYRSLTNVKSLAYRKDKGLSSDDLKMAVIVQEMVDAEFSGICFTIDPATGEDTTMLIEVSDGLGEDIVSGKTQPRQYHYRWFDENEVSEVSPYGNTFLDVQCLFGFPCDIEFAVKDGQLYLLQARKITKLNYSFTKDIWTTADFKDGGVSATVCTPYMWSLYEYIWEGALKSFLLDNEILKERDLPKKLGEMYYGRPYWNLSVVKKAMSRIIGYKEREFDEEYGITGSYEGDGETTKINPVSLIRIGVIALNYRRTLKGRMLAAQNLMDSLLSAYEGFQKTYADGSALPHIQEYFYRLTKNVYQESETAYFHQIFINTIHQSVSRDSLLKHISEEEYLTLLGGIVNISHLLPFYEMWKITRKIRADEDAHAFWTSRRVDEIMSYPDTEDFYRSHVKALIEVYGYHSDKELDVTYPCYHEAPSPIYATIKDMVTLEDTYSPEEDVKKSRAQYHAALEAIKARVPEKTYKKIETKAEEIRTLLWWREEFRDISTRFYYLIRIYTMAYAEQLVKDQVLKDVSDIWFLKVGDLWDHIDGKRSAEELAERIEQNRTYYRAYRNYMSENEIGPKILTIDGSKNRKAQDVVVAGLGAGNGIVTGTARVIHDLKEIDRLQEGDILVTRFTDTGWTPKMAILKGIVTEYGGILCHAAIVSREYGIPAVVSCKDAMRLIRDGETITINGITGEVRR